MIAEAIAAAGGVVALVEKLVELFDKHDDREGYRADVTALLSHVRSDEEIRARLRGELQRDTDPAPAPTGDHEVEPVTWRDEITRVDQ